jgi:hypothetical protein
VIGSVFDREADLHWVTGAPGPDLRPDPSFRDAAKREASMMKSRLWAGPVTAISTFAAITLAGMMSVNSSLVHAQDGNNQGNDSVKIQLGFAIAPVPLNLVGKDPR